ncbi:MAG: c-type cytochrome [Anaerolineales bacterium]
MNEQDKQEYLEEYHEAKEKGSPFFPDILFKDALISLLILGVLIALAYFFGAPLEARANPADTTYTPRPEWYFLFLFQLLKYFPGKLEVLGVIAIPTIVILTLFALPFLDRSKDRHFFSRPIVTGATGLLVVGVAFLTVQAVREAPPPAETSQGDPVAALYTANCAPCHGANIDVPPGTNLHSIIAQGVHGQGMPAWSGDLSTDQIDALAGFILSPKGSQLFTDNCSECHDVSDLVAGDPTQLKSALEASPSFAPHDGQDVPDFSQTLNAEDRTSLLNFLIAPDGQRLFSVDCSGCHGRSVAFAGSESDLRNIIAKGGMHLEMPPWKGRLPDSDVDQLAKFVIDPLGNPEAEGLFRQYCSDCHGGLVPLAKNEEEAREVILQGGPHQTMPVWGSVLTSQQLDALVSYTLEAAQGTGPELGQQLFAENCSPCHGDFGEGGPNPTRAGDIIAPISSAEYLKTRDDTTLKSIISQGQPNFGMSPFGSAYGGPLDDDQVNSIVAYIRSWEANPPVELPPDVASGAVALSGSEVYTDLCAQCHGSQGQGGVGTALADPAFQQSQTDQQIFDAINLGHKQTAMIGWGEILTSDQIQQLVTYIRSLTPTTPGASAEPSFARDVLPVFQQRCVFCHGTDGGWDSSSYKSVMSTGDNGPVVVPGDVANSLLAQKLQGLQTDGKVMPPTGKLSDAVIQPILDWIAAGAPDN